MYSKFKRFWNGLNQPDRKLLLLITPSISSGLIVLLATTGMIVASIIAVGLPGTALWELMHSDTPNTPPVIRSAEPDNSFLSNLPLLILWGGVGAIVYAFVSAMSRAYKNADDFIKEMDYLNINRRALVMDAVLKLAIRAGVLLVWVLYIRMTVDILLPYGLACVRIAVESVVLTERIGYLGLAFAILATTFHLHVILIRLLRLRPRVFGQV